MTERPQATLGGPGTAGHPDLEDLAALANGRCQAVDAKRFREHLASCEECYEVFLDTLRLREALGEADPVAPFLPSVRKRAVPLWMGAVAALLVVGIGLGLWWAIRGAPTLSVASLAARTGKVQKIDQLAWGERTRGGGSSTEDPSFRLGVELLNLQVALQEGDTNSADGAAAAVNGLFDSITFPDPSSKDYYRNLRIQLLKQRPESLSAEAAKQANVLRNSTSVGDLVFDLGTWAEAGRFAAYSRNPAFFDRKSAEHFLDKLPQEEPPPEAIVALKTIDAKLAAPNLQPKDYEELKGAFDQILRAYYPQGARGGL